MEERFSSPTVSAQVSLSAGMSRTRSHLFAGAGLRSTSGGSRVEGTRSTHVNWAAHARHTGYLRSRSNSATAPSTVPRRMSQDTARYVTNAAAKTHAILEKFTEQMKTYHTFQPTFVDDGIYSTFMAPKATSPGSTAWKTVGKILDAATSRAVRHNAESHLMSTIEKIPSVKEPMSNRLMHTAKKEYSYNVSSSYSSPSRIYGKADAAFYLWYREHPNATREEIRQELQFRTNIRMEEEQLSLQKMKKEWQAELDELLGEPSPNDMSLYSSAATPHKEMTEESLKLLTERFAQRLLWDTFLSGEMPSENEMIMSTTPMPAPASDIISDYCKGNELQEWMEGKWRHHTHRHENAALRIQCAYRSHRARLITSRKRYIRRIAFIEARRVEEENIRAWNTALRVMTDEMKNTRDNFDTTWRSFNYVVAKLQAKVIARRARKRMEMERTREIREYAALNIQRVYRGYRGREKMRNIRFPELFEQKRKQRLEAAIIRLQAAWKGQIIRKTIRRQIAAVLVIQRLVRSSAARKRLRYLRSARQTDTKRSTEHFAALKVCHWIEGIILRRREYILRFHEQAELLQRVTRGLFVRLALHRQQKSFHRVVLWIQRHFRGMRGRELARQKRDMRDAAFQNMRRVDAATVIKRSWRRSVELARRAQQKKLEEFQKFKLEMIVNRSFEEAAVMIQLWYRSMRTVRQMRAERDAARKELLVRESAERILCFYRSFKSRQHSLRSQAPRTTAAYMEEW